MLQWWELLVLVLGAALLVTAVLYFIRYATRRNDPLFIIAPRAEMFSA